MQRQQCQKSPMTDIPEQSRSPRCLPKLMWWGKQHFRPTKQKSPRSTKRQGKRFGGTRRSGMFLAAISPTLALAVSFDVHIHHAIGRLSPLPDWSGRKGRLSRICSGNTVGRIQCRCWLMRCSRCQMEASWIRGAQKAGQERGHSEAGISLSCRAEIFLSCNFEKLKSSCPVVLKIPCPSGACHGCPLYLASIRASLLRRLEHEMSGSL